MYKPSIYIIKISETAEKTTLFNTKTGALLRLPKIAYSVLEQSEIDDFSSKGYLKLLKDHSLCVPKDIDETEELISAAKEHLEGENPCIISFTIAVTTKCNLFCTYCFEKEVIREDMTFETAGAVAAFILSSIEVKPTLQVVELKWFGGEPLLTIPTIKLIADRVTRRCEQKNILCETRIITNGTLLSNEIVRDLLLYNLKSLHISMDGELDAYSRYKKGSSQSYKDVLNSIHKYCDKINMNIRLNCHKDNYNSILNLVKTLHADKKIRENVYIYLARITTDSENIKTFTQKEFAKAHLTFLNYLYDLGWHVQIKNALPISRPTPCGNLHKYNYSIDCNGKLYHCEKLLGQAEKCIGSVYFPENICNETIFEPVHICEKCKICTYLPICFDGCPQNTEKTDCASIKKETLDILQLIDKVSN